MKTSQTATERGLYSSSCCNHEQIFETGDTFTRCLKCMGLCEWDLSTPLLVCEELDDLDTVAA